MQQVNRLLSEELFVIGYFPLFEALTIGLKTWPLAELDCTEWSSRSYKSLTFWVGLSLST